MKQKLLKYILWFLGLILFFTLSMTLVYCIPNTVIDVRQSQAVDIIKNKEGWYPHYFWDTEAAQLDNATDRMMLGRNENARNGDNPLKSAMDVGDYPRYWHGYQIFLRPLLRLFSYEQIRYLNMGCFFLLLCLSFSMIHKKLGISTAICYLFSLIPLYLVIIPASLQFMSVFVVMFTAILYLTLFYGTPWLRDIPLFFMIIGVVTNFLDLLTAPLLTLGMPLAIFLCFELLNNNANSICTYLKKEFFASLAWTLGYGLCWFSKWLIASVVLQDNIVLNALNSIVFRTVGDEQNPINRTSMLEYNISYMFFSNGTKITYLFVMIIIILFMLFFFFHKKKSFWINILPFAILSSFPYVWFLVLANHSHIHAWFTFRIQAITVFCMLLILNHLIDWSRCRDVFKKQLRRLKQ